MKRRRSVPAGGTAPGRLRFLSNGHRIVFYQRSPDGSTVAQRLPMLTPGGRLVINAIRKVLAGGRYVSPTLAEKLAMDLNTRDTGRPLHETLSEREFEVLRMIASGKAVGEIAEEIHLSVATVSTYRARILLKMSMNTTAELIRYAIENRLVV